ncbi:MAG: DM13 domain-containing protein [Pseudomonadota bacterium]
MMRFLKIAIPVFVLGNVTGAAAWYLFSPLLFDEVVQEELVNADAFTELVAGTFRDADAAHRGSGNATILQNGSGETVLRLTEFEVTNGPDLEVWLSAVADPQSSSDVSGAQWLSLGQLKGNVGDQTYTIPADADVSQYQSVVIWCEQFGVLFSPATLSSAGS